LTEALDEVRLLPLSIESTTRGEAKRFVLVGRYSTLTPFFLSDLQRFPDKLLLAEIAIHSSMAPIETLSSLLEDFGIRLKTIEEQQDNLHCRLKNVSSPDVESEIIGLLKIVQDIILSIQKEKLGILELIKLQAEKDLRSLPIYFMLFLFLRPNHRFAKEESSTNTPAADQRL
jgi:hypothetical protein